MNYCDLEKFVVSWKSLAEIQKFQNNYGNFCKAVYVVLGHTICLPYVYIMFLCEKIITAVRILLESQNTFGVLDNIRTMRCCMVIMRTIRVTPVY